jgi:hypothetical protein
MCFALYAGTSNPIPRKPWRDESPTLSVNPLDEHDASIAAHFSMPHVQYVGSTAECGCDFPSIMYYNGEWNWYFSEKPDADDLAQEAIEKHNRESLVALLRQTGESMLELYVTWEGKFTEPPAIREEIALEEILDSEFRFKQRGFYVVHLE